MVIHPRFTNKGQDRELAPWLLQEAVALVDSTERFAVAHAETFRVRKEKSKWLFGKGTVERLREELDQPGKGGLHPGATVALSNGNAAVIREMDEEEGFVLIDANHPFAGADLQFAVKLTDIEDNPDEVEEA